MFQIMSAARSVKHGNANGGGLILPQVADPLLVSFLTHFQDSFKNLAVNPKNLILE